MKKKYFGALSIKFILLILFVLQTTISHVYGAEKSEKVAILPFAINSDQDLSYLREGIIDMLGSRLPVNGKIEVLGKGQVKDQLIAVETSQEREGRLLVGKALKADYVISGSLTALGNNLSLDASVLDVKTDSVVDTVFIQSDKDNIMSAIDQVAMDIKAVIAKKANIQIDGIAATDSGQKKVFMSDEPSFSQLLDFKIRGIDAGDVTGDGNNELVCISESTVQLYKWADDEFSLITTFDNKWFGDHIYVSVADMDNNGLAEVYVSNLTENSLDSFVIEWDGTSLTEILTDEKRFLKVVDIPGSGRTLIGQKRTRGNFGRYVYNLERSGEKISQVERLNVPIKANVFNFAQGNISGTGIETVLISQITERLYFYDKYGEKTWESSDFLGGLNVYMEDVDDEKGVSLKENYEETVYFSAPVLLRDIDKDGDSEVIICRNFSSVKRFFERARMYKTGVLYILSWENNELSPIWQSRSLPPLSGYCINDIDSDGKPEIIISSVVKSSNFFSFKKLSEVYIYNLD